MKYIFIALCSLFLSLTAFGQSQLQCDELKTKNGTHERFIISLDQYNRILEMNDLVWNDSTDSQSGSGNGFYLLNSRDPALAAEAEEGNFIYSFQTQKEGDSDFSGHLTDFTVTLSQKLAGPATVQLSYDGGDSGSDLFVLNCRVLPQIKANEGGGELLNKRDRKECSPN